MDAAAERNAGGIPRISTRSRMSGLTRDRKAEPVSRETKFSGAKGDRETLIFPVQLPTSRIGNLTGVIHTLAIINDDHTFAIYSVASKSKP